MPDNFLGTNWLDLLEENPGWGWMSRQNQWGQAPKRQKFFQNQFSNIYDRFLGQLGSQIRGTKPAPFAGGLDVGSPFTPDPRAGPVDPSMYRIDPTLTLGGSGNLGFAPTLRWEDYLNQNFGTPQAFNNYAYQFSPADRGMSTARFAPPTRFIGF